MILFSQFYIAPKKVTLLVECASFCKYQSNSFNARALDVIATMSRYPYGALNLVVAMMTTVSGKLRAGATL